MALPTRTELLTGEYQYRGEPFTPVEASPTVDPAYIYRGEPFHIIADAASGYAAWRMLLVFP